MDSMPIRERGFREVLAEYAEDEVAALVEFHRRNGGLSRYVKFRYFFETIRKEKITDEQIQQLARRFSQIMLEFLAKPDLLIQDSWDFVKRNYKLVDMHIVSGSDGEELNTICNNLNLTSYFKTIVGSPTTKKALVQDILSKNSYERVVMIGDSVNDMEAAISNGIDFFAFNNPMLKDYAVPYIEAFSSF